MSYTNGNDNGNGHRPKPKNVLGTDLKCCCLQPLTGWFRVTVLQEYADKED
jgi:uncharacterized protein (DUF2237 family)